MSLEKDSWVVVVCALILILLLPDAPSAIAGDIFHDDDSTAKKLGCDNLFVLVKVQTWVTGIWILSFWCRCLWSRYIECLCRYTHQADRLLRDSRIIPMADGNSYHILCVILVSGQHAPPPPPKKQLLKRRSY